MPASTSARDVFINCPFDPTYKPIFWAIVFTVLRSGFSPRCALEADDSSENRLSKIEAIIEECRYGIHDISRTEVDGDPPLPRFNMPLELGLFLGAKRYGNRDQKTKRALVLDREQTASRDSFPISPGLTFTPTAPNRANASNRLRHGSAPKAGIPRFPAAGRSPRSLRFFNPSFRRFVPTATLSPKN